jgi:hypothetical protein
LFGIILAARQKLKLLFLVFSSSIIFGLATQTGILEMSLYRGRSGWYLLLLSILGVAIIFDYYYDKTYSWLCTVAIIGCFLSAVVYPPKFYRAYYPETFNIVQRISEEFPNEEIMIIANSQNLSIISKYIHIITLTSWSLDTSFPTQQTFIILEKKFLNLDPIASQQAYSSDVGFVDFNQQQQAAKQSWSEVMQSNRQHAAFAQYSLYWENDNIEVYRYIKNN